VAVKSSSNNQSDTLRFSLGQRVWFALNDEEHGIITGIMFRPSGVVYYVTWADKSESNHFEAELAATKEEAEHHVE
jgi:hypothetical protein